MDTQCPQDARLAQFPGPFQLPGVLLLYGPPCSHPNWQTVRAEGRPRHGVSDEVSVCMQAAFPSCSAFTDRSPDAKHGLRVRRCVSSK